jgi:hypothetical protein
MNDQYQPNLRARVSSARDRQLSRARAELADKGTLAKDKLTTVAREHPLALIAGGLGIGIAISVMIPRSPTRRLGSRAWGLMGMVTELGIAYGRQAMDLARKRKSGSESEPQD